MCAYCIPNSTQRVCRSLNELKQSTHAGLLGARHMEKEKQGVLELGSRRARKCASHAYAPGCLNPGPRCRRCTGRHCRGATWVRVTSCKARSSTQSLESSRAPDADWKSNQGLCGIYNATSAASQESNNNQYWNAHLELRAGETRWRAGRAGNLRSRPSPDAF